MTLQSLCRYIASVGRTQPAVNEAGIGDVYELLNTPKSEKYAYFVVTPFNITETVDFRTYNLTLFYVDRLLENDANTLQIQSTAIDILSNIIRTVADRLDVTLPKIKYTVFTEKFNSLCAGAFAQIVLEAPIDFICPEEYEDE